MTSKLIYLAEEDWDFYIFTSRRIYIYSKTPQAICIVKTTPEKFHKTIPHSEEFLSEKFLCETDINDLGGEIEYHQEVKDLLKKMLPKHRKEFQKEYIRYRLEEI